MKIRTDFVTNSSSTSYVIGFKKNNELNEFNILMNNMDSYSKDYYLNNLCLDISNPINFKFTEDSTFDDFSYKYIYKINADDIVKLIEKNLDDFYNQVAYSVYHIYKKIGNKFITLAKYKELEKAVNRYFSYLSKDKYKYHSEKKKTADFNYINFWKNKVIDYYKSLIDKDDSHYIINISGEQLTNYFDNSKNIIFGYYK